METRKAAVSRDRAEVMRVILWLDKPAFLSPSLQFHEYSVHQEAFSIEETIKFKLFTIASLAPERVIGHRAID